MLNRSRDFTLNAGEHRRNGNQLIPIGFLGVATIVMIAWLAGIAWRVGV